MTRRTAAEPRCANGENCVAYPALGEPSKLSRGNPSPRCFACEERRVISNLKAAASHAGPRVTGWRSTSVESTPRSVAPGWSLSGAGSRCSPASGGCVRLAPLVMSASCAGGRGPLGKLRRGWLGPKWSSSEHAQQRAEGSQLVRSRSYGPFSYGGYFSAHSGA
jgi:hypothetical protein